MEGKYILQCTIKEESLAYQANLQNLAFKCWTIYCNETQGLGLSSLDGSVFRGRVRVQFLAPLTSTLHFGS